MKTSGAKSAFTLVELLVVIVIIAFLAALLLPRGIGHKQKPIQVICMSNQKQIAIGLILFQSDHSGKYPWQVSATNGGSMESVVDGQAFPQFRALSGYFGKQTRIFVCPTDKARLMATNYSEILNGNISYFLNLDANTIKPADSILSGDRNLQADGKPIKPGIFIANTNLNMNWTHDLHFSGGNLAFADGHVEWSQTNAINLRFARQSVATNRLCIP